ncbi:restriction endonuclease subunit S [Mycoplasmopsis cynos]|uniref:restriction endonuclease subunit S n=1 Tax=Mycoplasmopsis cynos TaxID=171284 RepID=UPI002AFE7C34|nr:restriction endonuclease subunit S [Mycoplasmopsis cynos]WQQ15729.1 restriction endonuclease subunit S [Mycoplasmopsis cynos]
MLILYYVWEQERLGNLYQFGKSGGTPLSSNKEFYNGHIPFLSITDISNSDTYIYKTEKNITLKGLKNSSAWIVPKDSISLAMYASIGKVAILKNNISTSQAIFNMVFSDELNLRDFIFYALKRMELLKLWNSLSSSGTQSNLTSEIIKNYKITLTKNFSERHKINKLFNKIYSLITLHQRELKILKNFKKSLFQKMIVGKNLTILSPLLTKMTNVWEQERFENIYQKYSVKNNFRLDFNKYISIATNTYKNDFTNISKDTLGNYILFKKGYVAFEGHTNIQFPFGRFVMNTIGDGIVSNIFSVFKPVFAQDLYYWKYAINNNKVMLEALKKSSKSGIMMNTLDIEVLNQQIILFPNQKEQNLIGLLFVLLDSLIALHQRELKILKIFKKSLFVKMIVGKNLTILPATLTKMTNVWEQERFENIYQKYSVKNNFRLDFNKYISIATNTYKNDFTNISKDTLGNYILFKKGYVAFEGHTNIQFPFGRFVMNTIGDGIVSNIFSVFKPVFAQDLYYWKYAINNNKVMLEALKKSSKSGIMMNTLDIEVLNQQIILFPNQKEQNLIGLLFVLLDSLIALHQRGQFRRENEKKIRNFVL